MDIQALVQDQRTHFQTGKTLGLAARRRALGKLRQAILAHEADIHTALAADLNKSPAEGYMCEVGMTLSELRYVEKHLARWMRDRRAATPLAQFHAQFARQDNMFGYVITKLTLG